MILLKGEFLSSPAISTRQSRRSKVTLFLRKPRSLGYFFLAIFVTWSIKLLHPSNFVSFYMFRNDNIMSFIDCCRLQEGQVFKIIKAEDHAMFFNPFVGGHSEGNSFQRALNCYQYCFFYNSNLCKMRITYFSFFQ